MKNFKASLCAFLLLLCAFSTSATAAPQVGWYWNPNESGRGFFVESQNGITFIGAYLYDDDGRAKWVIAGGPNNDPYNFSGDLIYKTNGQTLFGPYVAPGDAVVVGRLTVHFSDDTHATLTWPGGTIAIERQIFGTGTPAFPALPGWWWNSDESGRGYSVEVQGDKLFVVGFMYDDSGRPVWYLSAGSMASPTHYEGTWLQFANGQTMGGSYRSPDPPTTVGNLTIDFDGADEADFTFSDAPLSADIVGGAKAGRIRTVHTQREFNSPPPYHLPDRYDGNVHLESHLDETVTGGTVHVGYTMDGPLTLVKAPVDQDLPDFNLRNPQQAYIALPLSVPWTLTATYSSVDPGGTCTGSATTAVTPPTSGVLVHVSAYARYSGRIPIDVVSPEVPVTCVTDTGTFSFSIPATDQTVDLPISGPIVYGIQGSDRNSPAAGTLVSWRWSFAIANP